MAHTLRLPQIDLAAVLAQTHPSIDLRVHTYEESTRNFLRALTTYKNRAMTTIAERRKHQAAERKKLAERTAAVEAETGVCKLREVDLVAQLEREKEERKDAELQVAAFKRQLVALNERIASADTDIERLRAVTDNLRREKNKERATLSAFASHVAPESQTCEQRLRCTIEGVAADRLLVRFSHLDRANLEAEATFVIDVASENYKVITSSPPLPAMPILVQTLNESRDLYTFIKDVRAAYKQLMDPEAP